MHFIAILFLIKYSAYTKMDAHNINHTCVIQLWSPQHRLITMVEHEKNNLNVSAYHFNKNSKYSNKVFYVRKVIIMQIIYLHYQTSKNVVYLI